VAHNLVEVVGVAGPGVGGRPGEERGEVLVLGEVVAGMLVGCDQPGSLLRRPG